MTSPPLKERHSFSLTEQHLTEIRAGVKWLIADKLEASWLKAGGAILHFPEYSARHLCLSAEEVRMSSRDSKDFLADAERIMRCHDRNQSP